MLQLTRKGFYEMRPGEFWEALDAHSKEKEADRRHQGELARGAALRLFNIFVNKKSRITDPAEFWTMPWDEPSQVDPGLERLNSLTPGQRACEAREFIKKVGW